MHVIEENFYNALDQGYEDVLHRSASDVLLEMIEQTGGGGDPDGETWFDLPKQTAIDALTHLQAGAGLLRGLSKDS